MSENKQDNPKKNIDSSAFALAEYASLRDEMLKQIEFQHQIIALTFIVTGTFLSLGTQPNVGPLLLLVYPVLTVFLVLGWAQSSIRIQRIGIYIKENIESRVVGAGWEQFLVIKTGHIKRSMAILYARGAFVGTQIIAVFLALPKLSLSSAEIGLLLADGIAIIATLFLIRSDRPPFM
jgi:hypothetical protein